MSSSKQFGDRDLWGDFVPAEALDRLSQRPPTSGDPGLADFALARISVIRSAAELQRRAAKGLADLDISMARVEVLLSLFFAESLTPSELGRFAMTTRGNMTGLIEGLVTDGLVERVHAAGDRRSHQVKLTAAGTDKVQAYLPTHFAWTRSLMNGLTPAEARQLAVLLKKMRDGMRDPEKRAPMPE